MISATATVAELVSRGDLAVGDGYRTKRSELSIDGYRIIRVADVSDGRVFLTSPDHVRAEFARAIGTKVGRAGDVLLTTKGTIGRVARLPEGSGPVVYSPQICFFRVSDSSDIDAGFLQYWLTSPEFLRQASHRQSNTDMAPYISLTDLRSMVISVPPKSDQHAIAQVLGALDERIAANADTISRCDELSQLIYDRAVIDAVDQVPLSSVASFVNGRAFTKGASGTGRVVVRIAELNSGLGGSTVYSDAVVPDDHVARPGDLLFAWSGSLTVHRWFRDEAIVNQHIFKVIPKSGYPMWLVNQLVRRKLEDFRGIAADKATTMGHIQRHHLDQLVAVPTSEEIQELDAGQGSLWRLALSLEIENEQLATLRDTLLPQLMSGRLRVKDAEKKIEDVV